MIRSCERRFSALWGIEWRVDRAVSEEQRRDHPNEQGNHEPATDQTPDGQNDKVRQRQLATLRVGGFSHRGVYRRSLSRSRPPSARARLFARGLSIADLAMTVTLAFVPDVSAQVVLDVSCTVFGEGVQGYVRNPASLAKPGS